MESTIHRQRWKQKIFKGSHTPCIWRGIMSGEWLHMYWLCCKHELYESMSGWLDWGSRVPNKKLRRLESPFCCCEFLWSFTHFEILHLSKNHSQLFMFYWHVWIQRLSNNNNIITILRADLPFILPKAHLWELLTDLVLRVDFGVVPRTQSVSWSSM